MICTSCVREKPIESRKACIDIDVAYNQNLKKLDKALLVSGLVNFSLMIQLNNLLTIVSVGI